MSMLSAQRDKLRKVASDLQSIIDGLNKGHITYDSLMDTLNYGIQCLNGAADTIWQLRNDCVDLRFENEKLRELVRDAWGDGYPDKSCGDCEIMDECHAEIEEASKKGNSRWNTRCLFERRIEERMRDLGIEVDG